MTDGEQGDFKALLALATAMFTMTMGVGFIIPLLPVYAGTLGAGGLWIGLIFGVNPAVRAMFMPLFGRLADVRGKKRFLVCGLAGFCAVAFLMGVAGQAWHLFVLRVLQGAFSAMVMPVSRAYVGVLTPRGREGSVMGMFNLSFFLGFALGPLVGGILSDALGLRLPFYCMGALAAVALAIVAAYVPEQSGTGTGQPAITVPFRDLLASPIIVGLSWGRALNAMGRGAFASLLPVYAADLLLLSRTQIGLLVSTGSLFSSSLQPVAGALADRVNRKHLAVAGFLLSPLGLGLIPSARGFYDLLGIALIMGLSPGLFVPSSTAMAVVEGRKHGMGSTMGLVEMSMAVGMATGSTAGGAVAEFWGVISAFYAAALVTLAGAAVFVWYLRDYKAAAGRGARQEGKALG